jgi:hypothetical protein
LLDALLQIVLASWNVVTHQCTTNWNEIEAGCTALPDTDVFVSLVDVVVPVADVFVSLADVASLAGVIAPLADVFVSVADVFAPIADVFVSVADVFAPIADVFVSLAGADCGGAGGVKLALYKNPIALMATTVASCAFLQSSGVNPASIALVSMPAGRAGGGNLVVRLGIPVKEGHMKRKRKEAARGSDCIDRAMNLV